MLLIPRLTPVGAALLFSPMTGAVLSHLFLIGRSPVPALVVVLRRDNPVGPVRNPESIAGQTDPPTGPAPNSETCEKAQISNLQH